MTAAAESMSGIQAPADRKAKAAERLRKRHAREARLKLSAFAAISISLTLLAVLVGAIVYKGLPGFKQTYVRLDVIFYPHAFFTPEETRASAKLSESHIVNAKYMKLARLALYSALNSTPKVQPKIPESCAEPDTALEKDKAVCARVNALLSRNADTDLLREIRNAPGLAGHTKSVWLLASGEVDAYEKGDIDLRVPETRRKLKDQQVNWIKALETAPDQRIKMRFNTGLFTFSDSSQPESAGLAVAITGSFFMMLTVLLLAVPLGIAAAIYLQEFAPENAFTGFIEVNINNLAAVPSIVFGLLGLAIFVTFADLPRSAPLTGGLVLSLMTLPTIMIATRTALISVPGSIREAALGVGASKMQSVFHHVVPLAMPGILTGTVIGVARALGETAPLLMIGMVAFVYRMPAGPLDSSTALPVAAFMWSKEPGPEFMERAAAATMVLLGLMFALSVIAALLRHRFERKW
jgi:phosphate transport system permease protein